MFDLEREEERRTYQLCRLGFGFLAAALGIACLFSLLSLLGSFEPNVGEMMRGHSWHQWVDTPIVWFSLIGATLLCGRWNQPSWQRRSGLLLAICTVVIGLWLLSSGENLGLRVGDFGDPWLRDKAREALTWSKFALLASLAGTYLAHLGVDHAGESEKSARSMAATGAMIWILLFCQQAHWAAGWPLQRRRMIGLESHLLYHGFHLIWVITLIQVTALLISAVRQSSFVLDEMNREDQASDLLRSRSEPPRDQDEAAAARQGGYSPLDASRRRT
jgi:hypothetical protein